MKRELQNGFEDFRASASIMKAYVYMYNKGPVYRYAQRVKNTVNPPHIIHSVCTVACSVSVRQSHHVKGCMTGDDILGKRFPWESQTYHVNGKLRITYITLTMCKL